MGQLSRWALFRGNCIGGKVRGDNCPGGNFMWGLLSEGQLFKGILFRSNCLGSQKCRG